MSYSLKKIKLSKITKIQCYINSKKKTLATVMKETGADYGINGTLYNSDWTPCENLKSNGIVYAKSQWNSYGMAWEKGSDINVCWVPLQTIMNNYISGNCLVSNVYGLNFELTYGRELSGKRGRTAVGITPNELVIYSCADGTDALTMENLQKKMYNYGCTNGSIALDGGQSVMAMSKDGSVNIVNKNRTKVQNYILFWFNDSDIPNNEESNNGGTTIMGDIKITNSYITRNPLYSSQTKRNKKQYMQHSTGTPGAMHEAIITGMNSKSATTGVEFVIDNTGIYQLLPLGIKSWHSGIGESGVSANNTHISCEICEPYATRVLDANWRPLKRDGKYNTTYAVTILQKELKAWGYDPNGIDGKFGPGCESALKKFQKNNGLSADGIAGPATIKKMRTRSGSYMKYNAKDPDNVKYFNTVYDYAVHLAACIMKKYDTDPFGKNNCICHSEGYIAGIATNHADVTHWFPEHGKSMNDFRSDVKACMNGTYKPLSGSVNTSGSGTTMDTTDEHANNVDILVNANPQIIGSGDYWKGNSYSTANVRALIAKMAEYVEAKEP